MTPFGLFLGKAAMISSSRSTSELPAPTSSAHTSPSSSELKSGPEICIDVVTQPITARPYRLHSGSSVPAADRRGTTHPVSRFFGKAQGWDWNFEGMFQFGSFDGGNIRAWSVASDTGYTFDDVSFSPRVGLRANIISGDRNPTNPDLQTVNALFPRGKYFGEIGLIGPYNLIDVHPNLTPHLNDQWTLSGAAVFYWRESLGDGIYDTFGGLVRPSDNSRARYIGTQADVVLGWEPTRWFSAELAYSVFASGQFIKDTGPSRTAHFVGFEAVVKF